MRTGKIVMRTGQVVMRTGQMVERRRVGIMIVDP